MGEWISTKARYPNKTDVYLVAFSNGGVWFATYKLSKYSSVHGVWVFDDDIPDATITHWQPLPEPPKDTP